MADQVEILEKSGEEHKKLRDLSKELENNYQKKILALFQGKIVSCFGGANWWKNSSENRISFWFILPISSFNLSKGELRDKIGQILTVKMIDILLFFV